MKCREVMIHVGFAILLLQTPLAAQEMIWSTTYGGQYNDNAYAGCQTDDGYILLGSTFSYGSGGFDFYALRLGSAGDTVWTNTYGSTDAELGYDVLATSDGGFVLLGSTRSYGAGGKDVYLVKIDSAGTMLWQKTFGGSGNDEGRSIRETSDDGFIICGTTSSFGSGYDDLYFVRTDSVGDTIWTTAVGGAGGESGSAVCLTGDGGFMAVGSTGSFGDGYSSIYGVRLDADGDTLWTEVYGGSGADYAYDLETTIDGGFVIAGGTSSSGAGYTDAYAVKIDAGGVVQWEKTYGGRYDDRAYAVTRTLDGGYLLAGSTESFGAAEIDIYAIKIAPTGDTAWTRRYGGTKSDYGRTVFQETGRDYLVLGYSFSNSAGGSDVYLAKIAGESTPVEDDFDHLYPDDFVLEQNYPNPFNAVTIISYTIPRRTDVQFTVYNILGQEVYHEEFGSTAMGSYSLEWNGRDTSGRDVASGVYFYRVITTESVQTKKMVLLK
ncbi:MAG: T9SS type A sorting domain-containing protein [candidate division Zixibacteria bacterium]|nr:T9SS type A sorting domain-containing protein [candidate division Zixibacteria bacterium]